MTRPAAPSREVIAPVSMSFIVASLLIALLINLLPWPQSAFVSAPDFVSLTVLYWCIHQSRRFGFTSAWLLGLVMDVANGTLFGQHALAYSVLAFAGIALHRRVLRFTMRDQVLHVIPLLLMTDLIVLAVRVAAGAAPPGIGYFTGGLIGGLLWPAACLLLALPQRLKRRSGYV
ncbi:MAG TPA: rod shape-determining protein MreD [Burkholderiales bacterium]|nr:rod shape-determining protein MreD [Burkholderiales bacterium]